MTTTVTSEHSLLEPASNAPRSTTAVRLTPSHPLTDTAYAAAHAEQDRRPVMPYEVLRALDSIRAALDSIGEGLALYEGDNGCTAELWAPVSVRLPVMREAVGKIEAMYRKL